MRLLPCSDSSLWQLSQFTMSTTSRLATAVAPSMPTYSMTLVTGILFTTPSMSTAGWPSIVTAAVPIALAGIGVPAVTLKIPGLPTTGVAPGLPKQVSGFNDIGWAAGAPLPVFVVVSGIPGDADRQAAGATVTGRELDIVEDIVIRAIQRIGDGQFDSWHGSNNHVGDIFQC